MTRPILYLPPQVEAQEMSREELLGRCWVSFTEDSYIVCEDPWYTDALSSDMDHFWRCVNDAFELRIVTDELVDNPSRFSICGAQLIAIMIGNGVLPND